MNTKENPFKAVKRGKGLQTPPKPKTSKPLPQEGKQAVEERQARTFRVSTQIQEEVGEKIDFLRIKMKKLKGRNVPIGEVIEEGLLLLEKSLK